MYQEIARIFKTYTGSMLGSMYSFMNNNKNLGEAPILDLQNKIVLIVDATNNSFLETDGLLEFINAISNSPYIRAHRYFDVKNTPDVAELKKFNQTAMTIVFPDKGTNPSNPSGPLTRELGCQMVAMRYQYVDNFLKDNTMFFNEAGSAFKLKPTNLRYIATSVKIAPANPAYSFAPRTQSYDLVGGTAFVVSDSSNKSTASTAYNLPAAVVAEAAAKPTVAAPIAPIAVAAKPTVATPFAPVAPIAGKPVMTIGIAKPAVFNPAAQAAADKAAADKAAADKAAAMNAAFIAYRNKQNALLKETSDKQVALAKAAADRKVKEASEKAAADAVYNKKLSSINSLNNFPKNLKTVYLAQANAERAAAYKVASDKANGIGVI